MNGDVRQIIRHRPDEGEGETYHRTWFNFDGAGRIWMVVQESYEWDGDPGHGPTAANATPSPFQGEGRGEGDMTRIARLFPLTLPLPQGGEGYADHEFADHMFTNHVKESAREFRYHSGRARYLMRDRDP